MECKECQIQLLDYLETDAQDRARFRDMETHLEECPACQSKLMETKRILADIKGLRISRIPVDTIDAIESSIVSKRSTGFAVRLKDFLANFLKFPNRIMTAVGATAVIIVGLGLVIRSHVREVERKDEARPGLAFQEAIDRKGKKLTDTLPHVREEPSKPFAAQQETILSSFTIQVAALKDLKKAQDMVSDLKRKGYSAYQETVQLPGKGTYYRVRVGHFKDWGEAELLVPRLRRENLEPIIIRE
jgi:hypothetical protein